MDYYGRTILLVEDEVLIAMAEERQLTGAGYNVITAFSGENAIDIVVRGEKRIDLILMDIDLGKGIDGTQAALEILKFRDIPVLFQSSHTEKDIVEKTEKITSYGYVVKHSGITILDASIKMAFRLHRAYMELKDKEENLLIKERAIESSINSIAISGPDDRVIYVNPSFLKLWGYKSKEDVNGILSSDFYEEPEKAGFTIEGLQSRGGWRGEMVARRKDGTVFDVETSVSIIYGQNNKIAGMITAFQDITKRKRSENDLRESRESYRVLVENINSFVCETDCQGVYTYLSPAYKTIAGYEPEELLGKNVIEQLHPDELDRWHSKQWSQMKISDTTKDIWRMKRKNGDWGWMECSVTFYEKTPGTIRAVGISNDITERIKEEERMKRIIRNHEKYLNEIRERVKNNATLIRTFIDFLMEIFADDLSKQMFIKAESRLRFCINVYEKYHILPGPAGLNLYYYIEDIIQTLTGVRGVDIGNIKLSEKLADVTLDVKWILPLGLILNELITNSLQYAYPAGNNGQILISHESDAGRITVCVADNGVGLSEQIRNNSSFGMGLSFVKKLADEIGGELSIVDNSGTKVFISFRL